jgi:hypothetical protein
MLVDDVLASVIERDGQDAAAQVDIRHVGQLGVDPGKQVLQRAIGERLKRAFVHEFSVRERVPLTRGRAGARGP